MQYSWGLEGGLEIFVEIDEHDYVNPYRGGRQEITPRYFRHFSNICYVELSDALIFSDTFRIRNSFHN